MVDHADSPCWTPAMVRKLLARSSGRVQELAAALARESSLEVDMRTLGASMDPARSVTALGPPLAKLVRDAARRYPQAPAPLEMVKSREGKRHFLDQDFWTALRQVHEIQGWPVPATPGWYWKHDPDYDGGFGRWEVVEVLQEEGLRWVHWDGTRPSVDTWERWGPRVPEPGLPQLHDEP